MRAIFNIATKNLFRNKLRSIMTICGTGIGLSLFIVLMTIAHSVKSQIHHMIDGFGVDVVVQAGGAPNPISSRIAVKDIAALSALPGVRSASGFVVGSKRLSWNRYFVLLGADPSAPIMSRFPIIQGTIFTNEANQILVGSLLAKRRKLRIGDPFPLDHHGAYRICGIYNTGVRAFDGAAITELSQAQEVLQRGDQVNLMVVRVDGQAPLETVMATITKNLPHLEVMRGLDFVGQIRVFDTILGFAQAIAFLSLIACSITVMDTLLMAISERTKEIGILMAIGWSRWQIAWIVLSESLLICLLGSAAGNLFGALFLWMTSDSQLLGIGWVPVWPSATIALSAVGLGLAMGCMSAAYPAAIAWRMLPATALRFEK